MLEQLYHAETTKQPCVPPKLAGVQLDLFKSTLPSKPYCTNALEQGLRIRPVSTAERMRYIQHNAVNSKTWLVYDIDRAITADEIYNDLHLPVPNLFIQNPVNAHAHVAYSLITPIHLNDNSSQKPIRFAAALDVSLQAALDADRGYAGLIMKNPLNEHWRTFIGTEKSYELNELADYVDLDRYTDKRVKVDVYGLGRNVRLFDQLRFWCYKNKIRFSSFEQWLNAVHERAENYNANFPAALPASEVRSTAKSVAKWVWARYDGTGSINRGRDALQGSFLVDLHDKQVLAASITNRERVGATREAITVAIMRLQAAGEKVSIRSVAKAANVSTKTVQNHKDLMP